MERERKIERDGERVEVRKRGREGDRSEKGKHTSHTQLSVAHT
jgi:hypothetical protein